MITLRPYQEQCIAGLRGAFARGFRAPLLVSPTGSGKTVMFSYLCGRLQSAGKRVVVLVHREELIEQVSRTLTAFGVKHGIIAAGCYYDRRLLVHVASVFTLVKRLASVEKPDYVIADEAHHAIAASSWGKVIEAWLTRTIGVTATPCRLSGEGLNEVFDEMVLGPTVAELIDAGALSDYRLFAPPIQADLSGLHTRGGDFARGEAAAAMDKPAVVGDAVQHYRRLCDGAPAVAFCVSVEHAEHVAEQFREAGYAAASIDGKMDRADRRRVVSDFSSGVLNVMTSCDLISEGFDVPGIVAAIGLRPTQSLGLCLQQWGRALRPADGKSHAILLDHVGNAARHGLPDDPRDWSLQGREKRKGKAQDDGPACRQCPRCYAVASLAATKCPECGHLFPVAARTVAEVDGNLEEVDLEARRRELARAQAAAKTAEDMVAKLGYSSGRAAHILEARAEKERLRNAVVQVVDDLRRAIGERPIPLSVIREMKPKELRGALAEMQAKLHAVALLENEQHDREPGAFLARAEYDKARAG